MPDPFLNSMEPESQMVMAKKDIPTKNNTVLLGDKVKASSGIVGTSNKKFYSSSNIPYLKSQIFLSFSSDTDKL